MRMWRVLRQRTRSLFNRSQIEKELHDELSLHLEQLEREYRESGMTNPEAREAARRAFGGVDVTAEACRDKRGVLVIEELIADVRYALRQLGRSHAFTATAVLSLALGIGATSAMYSLVSQVILGMLPVRNPQEIVVIAKNTSDHSGSSFSVPFLRDLEGAPDLPFEGFASSTSIHRLTMVTDSGAEAVRGEIVNGNYFNVLGVRPALGRVFMGDDDMDAGAHPVAVLSFNYWKRRFAQDPSVLNSTVRLNGHPFTIVGVSAAGFDSLTPGYSPDLRVTFSMEKSMGMLPGVSLVSSRSDSWIGIYGRLRPDTTAEQAAARLGPIAARDIELRAAASGQTAKTKRFPASQQMLVSPAPQGSGGIGRMYNQALWVLTGAAGAVLLLACVNIAHLLLARASRRDQEFRIRLSLGARRVRLIRQLLTESLVLGLLGAAAGLPFAWALGRLILVLAIQDQARSTWRSMPDGKVLGFTFGLAILTAIAFGLWPAVRASSHELAARGRGIGSRAFISAQIALSLVLLAGAGLFVRSLFTLRNVHTGFRADGLLQAGLDPMEDRQEAVTRFYKAVVAEVRTIPGIQSVSIGRHGMIAGQGWSSGIRVEGFTERSDDISPNRDAVGSSYFSTLGIPLLMGREFSESDTRNAPKVAIVNEAFAKRYFAGQNPLGKRIGPGGRAPEYTVVGVTKNARYKSLRETLTPYWYVPFEQLEEGSAARAMTIFVRSASRPESVVASLRQAVAKVDRNVALFDVRTLNAQADENVRRERLLATLCILFGAFAALLAGAGLLGVLSWSVGCRTREIGIRMALGALPYQAAWTILRGIVGFVGVGIGAGLAGSLALGSVVQFLLYGIAPNDVIALAGAGFATLVIAVVATIVPARAAASVHPASTLRAE